MDEAVFCVLWLALRKAVQRHSGWLYLTESVYSQASEAEPAAGPMGEAHSQLCVAARLYEFSLQTGSTQACQSRDCALDLC